MNNKFIKTIYLIFCLPALTFSLVTSVNAESIKIILNSPLKKEGPNESCTTEICLDLLKLIHKSKQSIDFAIYGMRGQEEILIALKEAKRRGVHVRGIVDKDVDNKSYYSDTYNLERQLKGIRSDYDADLRTEKKLKNKTFGGSSRCQRPSGKKGPLQCFEGQGYASKRKIYFKGDIMHNKFFVVDNRFVWTGSANVSDTGTGGYNSNLVILADSSSLANAYKKEFEQMYLEGKYHREKTGNILKNKFKINGSAVSLYFSPQNRPITKALVPLIENAKKSIDICIFFLTHNEASKELVKAYERGVEVRVIIDATGAMNGYSKHQFLRDNGIPVKVENWGGKMHMKAAVFDEKTLVAGSMNWTKAGNIKNDENILVIKDSRLSKKYTEFFNILWRAIPNTWLTHDPKPESVDSVFSCSDGIDNDFDKKIDLVEADCD